jgi:hypothetical protein
MEFVKVTFGPVTKRLASPPVGLDQLREKIVAKFAVLALLMQQQQRPQDMNLLFQQSLVQTQTDYDRLRRSK